MRSTLALALAALLAAPSVAAARRDDRPAPAPGHGNGHGNGRGDGNGHGRGGGGGAPAPSPAPAPGGGRYAPAPYPGGPAGHRGYAPAPSYAVASAPAPYHRYGPALLPGATVLAPVWWWGWDWGWGYYPLYPRPAAEQVPEAGAERIVTTLSGGLSSRRDGTATGGALAIEGRSAGFEATIDAITIPGMTGDTLGSSSAIGWGTTHVTWSVVSEDAFRLRLETGASMISMPAGGTSAGMPWAGKIVFGPDLGVSGHVGLLGPIGIEGHARLTPVPVPVADARAAVALRGGPLALAAGWRSIRVMGDGVDAPALRFSGPEIRLALIF